MKLYKVLSADGKSCHGGYAEWHLPTGKRPGKWMPPIDGELEPCSNGYHVCRRGQLMEWLGEAIYECESRGERINAGDKIVVREVRLVKRIKWDDRISRLFACDCAERALKYASPVDVETLRESIAVARRYANWDVTVEELTAAEAAWDAAWDAAWAAARAARSAAGDAARAARSAERKWQTRRLFDYLEGRRG